MIDFVNLSVYNLLFSKWLENAILREKGFDKILVSEDTGEILSRGNAEYKGLIFKLIPSTKITGEYVKTVSGSLHKYFNGGEHNHNRFTHIDCVRIINELSEMFDINPTDSVLHGLEFGVNLYLPYSPQRVIKSVVVHGNKPYEAIQSNRRKGVVCVRSEYSIKIYDKGYTDKQPQKNILRIEYRVTDMSHLGKFGVKLLSDLMDENKVNFLLDLLLGALENTIFIPTDLEIERLTNHEKINFHAMGKPLFWKELTRKQRHDKRLSIEKILKKCNAIDYKTELIYRVESEWKMLLFSLNEAGKTVTFSTILKADEAHGKGNVFDSSFSIENVTSRQEKQNTGNGSKNEVFNNHVRTCKTCGKDISMNRKESLFCSIKNNPLAKRCRNKDSNKRRTFKAQIMRAKNNDKWLRITYKDLDNPDRPNFTDTLHSSEVTVNRGWLNTIVSIEILHEAPTLYGNANEPHTEILTGVNARNYASCLTRENSNEDN